MDSVGGSVGGGEASFGSGGIKETVVDALAAAAGVGAALSPGSGPFSPGGRYGPSHSMGGNNFHSSSNTLTGSILLSPKQASDGDTIPFGSSSYVQQQQNLNSHSEHPKCCESETYYNI